MAASGTDTLAASTPPSPRLARTFGIQNFIKTWNATSETGTSCYSVGGVSSRFGSVDSERQNLIWIGFGKSFSTVTKNTFPGPEPLASEAMTSRTTHQMIKIKIKAWQIICHLTTRPKTTRLPAPQLFPPGATQAVHLLI